MGPNNFKLEAGKFYKTRDGRKAFVAGISPFASTAECRRASGWIDGEEDATDWFVSGRYESYRLSDDDLVSEWKEAKRIKCFVPVYGRDSDGDQQLGYGYETREKAQKVASRGLLAIVEIDVEEGHGLNGEAA